MSRPAPAVDPRSNMSTHSFHSRVHTLAPCDALIGRSKARARNLPARLDATNDLDRPDGQFHPAPENAGDGWMTPPRLELDKGGSGAGRLVVPCRVVCGAASAMKLTDVPAGPDCAAHPRDAVRRTILRGGWFRAELLTHRRSAG